MLLGKGNIDLINTYSSKYGSCDKGSCQGRLQSHKVIQLKRRFQFSYHSFCCPPGLWFRNWLTMRRCQMGPRYQQKSWSRMGLGTTHFSIVLWQRLTARSLFFNILHNTLFIQYKTQVKTNVDLLINTKLLIVSLHYMCLIYIEAPRLHQTLH